MITFGGHSPTCHSLTSYSFHCWFLCTGLRGVASSAEVRMTWPRSSTCSSIAFGARRWGRCSKIWSVSSAPGWDSVNPCFTLFFTPQKYKLCFSSCSDQGVQPEQLLHMCRCLHNTRWRQQDGAYASNVREYRKVRAWLVFVICFEIDRLSLFEASLFDWNDYWVREWRSFLEKYCSSPIAKHICNLANCFFKFQIRFLINLARI